MFCLFSTRCGPGQPFRLEKIDRLGRLRRRAGERQDQSSRPVCTTAQAQAPRAPGQLHPPVRSVPQVVAEGYARLVEVPAKRHPEAAGRTVAGYDAVKNRVSLPPGPMRIRTGRWQRGQCPE